VAVAYLGEYGAMASGMPRTSHIHVVYPDISLYRAQFVALFV